MGRENVVYYNERGKVVTDENTLQVCLPLYVQLENIGWRIVDSRQGKSPQILELHDLHPDESAITPIVSKVMSNFKVPRLAIDHPHLLAAQLGKRSYMVPYDTNHYITSEIIKVDGRRARNIDLNRQFQIPDIPKISWRKILSYIKYDPARLLLDFIKKFKHLEIGVSWHQDLDREKEIYLYDIVPDKLNDRHHEKVQELMNNLRAILKKSGHSLFTGIDDPRLNNWIDDGYICQQARNEQTDNLDGSVECAAVELGRKGLTNFKRFVTVEMPSGLRDEQMSEVIEIINSAFLIPLYQAYGISIY